MFFHPAAKAARLLASRSVATLQDAKAVCKDFKEKARRLYPSLSFDKLNTDEMSRSLFALMFPTDLDTKDVTKDTLASRMSQVRGVLLEYSIALDLPTQLPVLLLQL